VTPRQLLRILISVLVVSLSLPVLAANRRDAATLKKIDEALNVHYLAADYDKAEKVLQSALEACGTKFCSGEVLAKAYVAIGVIRGNAKQDLAGARTAFESAKAADPNATLDATVVTPAVLALFYKAMGRELPPEQTKAKPAQTSDSGMSDSNDPAGSARVSPAGELHCTPISAHEIQTAQPIAVVCEPLEGVVRAELYYRMQGEGEYTAILMSVQDGTLRATIPCEAVAKKGKLEIYVIAQDFNKEMIDTFGNRVTPAHYRIVDKTKQPVPSFPGTAPPKRCEELLIVVAKEGEACSPTKACKHGLYCAEGTCLNAPACETDSDCDNKHCSSGYCAMNQDLPEVDNVPKKFMFGLHAGLDIWLAPTVKQVCGDESLLAGNYNCYNSGEDVIYVNTPEKTNNLGMANPGAAGNVDAGVRLATWRILLSGDYVLTNHFTIGGRLGWAFGGGPQAIKLTNGVAEQTKRFLPVHLEARATLWLKSLGKTGLHPYVHVSLGVAEVDAKIPINIRLTLNGGQVITRPIDAWRKMGTTFVGGGGGALYDLGKKFGVQLNLNAMYMLPSTGLIFEPTLGAVLKF